jgi:putative membrane protein
MEMPPPVDTTEAPPPAPEEPPAPAMEKMSDEQVADVLASSDQARVDEAKLAQKKAKNARVKKFAAMMLKEHGDSQKKLMALTKKLSISVASSSLSSEIKIGTSTTQEKLKSMSGEEFDIAYMDAQVNAHQNLLDALDKKLSPQVTSEELRTFVGEQRLVVEKHLTEAREISQAILASSATANPPPAPPGSVKSK